jgi:hypothetical protein
VRDRKVPPDPPNDLPRGTLADAVAELEHLRPGPPWSPGSASLALSIVSVGVRRLRQDRLASEDADQLEVLLRDVADWLRDEWRRMVRLNLHAGESS